MFTETYFSDTQIPEIRFQTTTQENVFLNPSFQKWHNINSYRYIPDLIFFFFNSLVFNFFFFAHYNIDLKYILPSNIVQYCIITSYRIKCVGEKNVYINAGLIFYIGNIIIVTNFTNFFFAQALYCQPHTNVDILQELVEQLNYNRLTCENHVF